MNFYAGKLGARKPIGVNGSMVLETRIPHECAWADIKLLHPGHRGEIHEVCWNHALEVGVDIRLGCKVQGYFETETEAGVVVNGERIVGDVVLAGDGVRSLARTIVLGFEDKPKSSGYAVYRAWMPTEGLKKNPSTAWLANPDKDL